MCKALIIGAGGVGTVVAQKIAANPIFSDVMLASRTKAKCLSLIHISDDYADSHVHYVALEGKFPKFFEKSHIR